MSTIKVLVTTEYEIESEDMLEMIDFDEGTIVNTEVIYPKVERVK